MHQCGTAKEGSCAMALRTKLCRVEVLVPFANATAIKKRAKELGYGSLAHYVRVLLSRELRNPAIPSARSLLSTRSRGIAERNPLEPRPTNKRLGQEPAAQSTYDRTR